MRTINYPGNNGQRCQARFGIGPSETRTGAFPRTEVLFVEDERDNPGGTFCNNGYVPDFLANKLLNTELKGCKIDFIDFFYAGLPDLLGRRDVYFWPIAPDMDDCDRCREKHGSSRYSSFLDRLQGLFGLYSNKGILHNSSADIIGGACRVRVDAPHKLLPEEERIRVLHRFGVLSR